MIQLDEAVEVIAWSADGALLAAGDLGGDLAIAEPRCAATVERDLHPGGVTALDWSSSVAVLASGGVDGTARIRHAELGPPMDAGGAVRSVRWSQLGDLLAIGAGASVLVVTASGAPVASYPLLPGMVHGLVWAPGPGPLAAATHDSLAWLQPGAGAEPVDRWPAVGAAIHVVADRANGRLAWVDLADRLHVANLASGAEVELTGWPERITSLAWGSAGELAVASGCEVAVCRFGGPDAATDGDEVVPRRVHHHRVRMVAFGGRDGTTLASGDDGGDLALGVPGDHPDWAAQGAPVQAIAWRPGRDEVATGTADGRISLVAH